MTSVLPIAAQAAWLSALQGRAALWSAQVPGHLARPERGDAILTIADALLASDLS